MTALQIFNQISLGQFNRLVSLVLRFRYISEKAKYKLGEKFGCCPTSEPPGLFKLAKNLGLNVVGVSFHIGSNCEDYDAFGEAIKISRRIFRIAASIGLELNILDLGGGFPGDSFSRIDEFSGEINRALDENFPLEEFPSLKIFSEPGRYFIESAFSLVTVIHSRKVIKAADGKVLKVMYYLDEGVYSNFLIVPLGPEVVHPKILQANRSDEKFNSILWGEFKTNFALLLRRLNLFKIQVQRWTP